MAQWLVLYGDLSYFPMEITTLGFTCTTCAYSSLSQHAKGPTRNWAHARVALNASYTLVLNWCWSNEVAVSVCLLNANMHISGISSVAPSVILQILHIMNLQCRYYLSVLLCILPFAFRRKKGSLMITPSWCISWCKERKIVALRLGGSRSSYYKDLCK